MLQYMTNASLARSVLRHRPIATETETQRRVVQTPRASRAKRMHEPPISGFPSSVAKSPTRIRRSQASGTWLIYLVLGMCVSMLLLWALQNLWQWGNTTIDDFRYGRPRTTQVDHFVGHETSNVPSHFIATNLSGQIYVVEIPGGNASASHLLVGPHLVGLGADLAPVSLSFLGDAYHPDLLVTVNGIQVRFRNTGDAYVPVVDAK